MEPYGIIYCITNKINKKSYIGFTTQTLENRWRDHCKLTRIGVGYALHRSMRKYGTNNFSIEKIDYFYKKEDINCKEQYWIKKLNTYIENGLGYNETLGGDGVHLLEGIVKEKIRKANTGKKHSDKTKEKLRIARSKQVITPESRKKAIETRRKNGWDKNQEETSRKRVETRRKNGTYIMKEETKEKLRIINTGRKHSEETKRKMSIKSKGRKMSVEAVIKRNESRRRNNNGKY